MTRASGFGLLFVALAIYLGTGCGGSSSSADAQATSKDTVYADAPGGDDASDGTPAPDQTVEPSDAVEDQTVDTTGEDQVAPPDTNLPDTIVAGCPQKTWPEKVFSFTADGVITTAPAITPKGYIVFGTRNGTVYAVDCNGAKVWSWSYTCTDANCPDEYVGSVVVTSDGTIIVADDNKTPNFVFFLSEEGVELKKYQSDSVNGLVSTGGVLTTDGTFVLPTNGGLEGDTPAGELWGLNPVDGTMIADFPLLTLPVGTSPPATLLNIVYLPSVTGPTRQLHLVAVNLLGQEIHRLTLPAENKHTTFSGVALDDLGFLVFARNIGFSDDGLTAPYAFLHRLSPFTGVQTFERQIAVDSNVVGSPVIRKGPNGSQVIVAFDNGRLAAFDTSKVSGNPLLFEATQSGFVQTSPLLGQDGRIYLAVDDGIYAFDSGGKPVSGSYTASERVVTAMTMGVNGALYFGTFDGKLHAIGTTSGALESSAPWPKLHGDERNTGNYGGTLAQCAPHIPLDPFSVEITAPAPSVSGTATVTALTEEASCSKVEFSTPAGTLSVCYVLTGGSKIALKSLDSVTLRYDSGSVNGLVQRRLVIWRADGELIFHFFDGLPSFAANTQCGGVEPCPVALWGTGACVPKSTSCGRVVYPSVRLELRRTVPAKCNETHVVARGTKEIVKNTAGCPVYDALVFVPDAVKYLERTCDDPTSNDRISVAFLRTGP